MIKSMTGFGKGQTLGKLGTITVEIRSLNHKYFDFFGHLPNHFSFFEDRLRDYLKKKIRRGRVNLGVTWESKQKARAAFSLDFDLARRYHRELLKLRKNLGIKNNLGIAELMQLPEVLTFEQARPGSRQLWPYFKSALDQALQRLNRMREAEGRRLMRDLIRRVKKIHFCLRNIEVQLPQVIERYRSNLFQKVRTLSGIKKVDRDRIAEEVALFVRNSDVSEELTRIKSHLKGFKSALRNQKEAGKELDFIAQELFREANTIGSKASSFKITRWVIKIKSQIEKIREQLQNVE